MCYQWVAPGNLRKQGKTYFAYSFCDRLLIKNKHTKKKTQKKVFAWLSCHPKSPSWDRGLCVHPSSSSETSQKRAKGWVAGRQHISLTVLNWSKGRDLRHPVQSGNMHIESLHPISETSKSPQWVRWDNRRSRATEWANNLKFCFQGLLPLASTLPIKSAGISLRTSNRSGFPWLIPLNACMQRKAGEV